MRAEDRGSRGIGINLARGFLFVVEGVDRVIRVRGVRKLRGRDRGSGIRGVTHEIPGRRVCAVAYHAVHAQCRSIRATNAVVGARVVIFEVSAGRQGYSLQPPRVVRGILGGGFVRESTLVCSSRMRADVEFLW